jgi:hypothetical protein
MTPPIGYQRSASLRQIIARLDEQGIAHASIPLANGATLVAMALGGRIFAFLPDREECLYWVNPAFADPQAFAHFVRGKEWNIGGDRVWVGPEIQFIIQERSAEVGRSMSAVPPAMDPGAFTLKQTEPGAWKLAQTMTLDAYCIAEGTVSLQLDRTVRPLDDPLAGTGISEGVWFAGYEQQIALRRIGGDPIPASWWSVTNLHAGGDVLIATLPGVTYDDFITPAPTELHALQPGYVRARVTGDRWYKTGYDARCVTGRFAYLHQTSPNGGYLLVRAFYSNPAGRYLEEPAHQTGRNGHSMFVYDDGRFGGFGEFECMGAAIGGPGDPAGCLDRVPLWIYAGEPARLRAVAGALLGIAL